MTSYGSFDDPFCYPGSSVLRNKQGIRTSGEFEAFEVAMVMLRSGEPLPDGHYDAYHYRAIHHHLFQDVYDWAGDYRTIRIAKEGAMFCYPEHIAGQMDALFTSLQTPSFMMGATVQPFLTGTAQFLGDLNAIHPFREGNGRTQLTFLFLLGERAGHALDMARIRPAEMLVAMISSFQGRLKPLEKEIARLLV